MSVCARTVTTWTSWSAAVLFVVGGALMPAQAFAQTPPKQTPPPAAVKPATPATPATQAAKPATPATSGTQTAKPAAAPAAAAKPAEAPKPAAPASKLDAMAGNWDGAAQTSNGELPIRVTLAARDGKMGGSIESQMGSMPLTSVVLTGDTLEVGFEMQGAVGGLTGKVSGDRIEGSWSLGSESGGFVVNRNPPSAAGAQAAPAAAAAADPISGEWDGAVDIAGQSMPFTLTLKLSGENVTGDISSGAGKTPLNASTWKDGTLALSFPYMGGEPVVMGGKLVEGKLTGVVNYNGGEMSGTFTASKKK